MLFCCVVPHCTCIALLRGALHVYHIKLHIPTHLKTKEVWSKRMFVCICMFRYHVCTGELAVCEHTPIDRKSHNWKQKIVMQTAGVRGGGKENYCLCTLFGLGVCKGRDAHAMCTGGGV